MVHAGGPLAPVLTIAAQAAAGPCVVVTDGPPSADQVRAALLDGALDVIGWPGDRGRLLEAPLRVRANRRRAGGPALFRVAGGGGGAGASTVALAIGGLVAWSGRRAVVVGGDDLVALCAAGPWTGPGAAELAALDPDGAAVEVEALARPVPGVDGLRVLGGGAVALDPAGWPVEAVVVDLRSPASSGAPPSRPGAQAPAGGYGLPVDRVGLAAAGADLVVARADHRLRVLAAGPADVPVVVVEGGPLDRAGVRRVLGRAPVGWLPESARVARAGVQGRVPAGLPGSWLAALRAVLGRVRR